MLNETQDVDINKAFEEILLAEDLAEQSAYEEGFNSGQKQMLDGYHVGYHRASSLAAQLGYFAGVLTYIKCTSNVEKITEQTDKLLKDIKKFPTHNDDAVDIFDQFENIKLNFKKVCSLAKVDPKYPEANKTDF